MLLEYLARVASAIRYQKDKVNQQEPTTAAGQSQGGGKCAHRPRGASQPPKPTTDGASTSFPVAYSSHPPTLAHSLVPSIPQRCVSYVSFAVSAVRVVQQCLCLIRDKQNIGLLMAQRHGGISSRSCVYELRELSDREKCRLAGEIVPASFH